MCVNRCEDRQASALSLVARVMISSKSARINSTSAREPSETLFTTLSATDLRRTGNDAVLFLGGDRDSSRIGPDDVAYRYNTQLTDTSVRVWSGISQSQFITAREVIGAAAATEASVPSDATFLLSVKGAPFSPVTSPQVDSRGNSIHWRISLTTCETALSQPVSIRKPSR